MATRERESVDTLSEAPRPLKTLRSPKQPLVRETHRTDKGSLEVPSIGV